MSDLPPFQSASLLAAVAKTAQLRVLVGWSVAHITRTTTAAAGCVRVHTELTAPCCFYYQNCLLLAATIVHTKTTNAVRFAASLKDSTAAG
jgi:hypothetical protein